FPCSEPPIIAGFSVSSTPYFKDFRTLSASVSQLRCRCVGEANYMPAKPIWEVFCEKFFTKLPKICATPQSPLRKAFKAPATATSI
ncbi:hypothetical protein, partial [Xanthomonas vasicola]|uniref:hypothetical protein n=1 Tax=Xanthomonas vasicola TaxID=56459 RepID=UPI001BAF2E78